MSNALKGPAFALLGFLLFSTHDAIIKSLGSTYSPFQVVFYSVLLGFPLATILLMRDETSGTLIPRFPGWVFLRTIAAMIGAVSGFYAFTVLPLSQVYAIIFTVPLLITVLSIPILGEKVGIHRWGAVILGLIGVAIVVRPGAVPIELGHIAAFVAAFCGALASVIVRRIGREERSIVIMLYPMVGNVLFMGAALPFVYQPVPIEDMGAMASIAVFGFSAGLCIIAAYRHSSAATIAPVQYSQIIWAIIFGALFFNEYPDFYTLLGAGIVILSGLYVLVREAFSNRSENTPVLRNRSRMSTPSSLRIGPLLHARQEKDDAEQSDK